jgi:hypothetical protein
MRRFVLVLIMLLLNAQLVSAIDAGAIEAIATSCDPLSVDMVFVGAHEGDPASEDAGTIDLYDGDGTLVYQTGFVLAPNTNVTALLFTADQWITLPQANPMRMVVSDVSTGAIVWDYPFTIPCVTRTVDNPAISYASDGVQITLIEDEEGAFGFSLIGIGLDGDSGFPVVTITASDLAALPETVEENTLIAKGEQTTYWGDVSVYQLTTGEIQVNVGPDSEGKVRVTIYDAIPPTIVYGYDFNIYGVEPE